MEHVAGLDAITSTELFGHVDADTIHDVLAEVGRFMAEVVAPTNRDGDTIGAQWQPDGTVVTPDSFKPAYAKWVESGFGAMPFDPDYGGAGFPWISAIAVQELLTSANMAFSLCPLLTQGAIDAIHAHGSDEQKATYLPKMLTGEWSGTMNLTEPQAGSDVGAVTSKAEPDAEASARWGEGAYRITGQKIFITWGEHDCAEQILHLVLARTPGSPPGTKGISMFLVPKFLLEADGSLGERNGAHCVSIEHKLGIHGSPTCVMAYENAIGWLVGGEHEGMRNMFTMMNNARLSVGLEGLCISERAYQQALQYAQERLQGRAIGAEPGTSSPIIDHPDVRRMLMTQRAWIDAMRCLVYTTPPRSTWQTRRGRRATPTWLAPGRSAPTCSSRSPRVVHRRRQRDDVARRAGARGDGLRRGDGRRPALPRCSHRRDLRGHQRHPGGRPGRAQARHARWRCGDRPARRVRGDAAAAASIDGMGAFGERMTEAIDAARAATKHLVEVGPTDPRSLLAGSSPYLRLLGTTVCAGLLAKAAVAAPDDDFGTAKRTSARFFAEQILPTVVGLLPAVTASADDLYALSPAQLA